MNTGYIIKQYIDINPLSPTYNQTWTERTLDTGHCPQSADDWVEVGNYCEVVDVSGYTGNRQIVYYSDSLNAYSSVTYPDATCNVDSKEENWVNEGEPYCEIGEDGKNTGYMIQIQKQKNPNLINYGETREFKYLSDECGQPTPTGDTCPHWQEIMRYCYVINDSGTTMLDGSSNVAQIDVNEASDTYNQTRTINVYDSGCSNMAGTVFEWTEIGDYCGGSGILCDEGISSVKTTLYTVYRRTKTLNGVTTNMGEYSAVTKEIGSQSCGADVRRQWVRTDDTECVEYTPQAIKAILTLNDGSTVTISGSGVLTTGEVRPYSASCVSAEIGSACTSIGQSAFLRFSGLTSVIIGNSVTSIGPSAFYSGSSLTSVIIGNSVATIGSNAFIYCSSLTSVTIPNSVTTIGSGAFSNCRGLTSVSIPNSVTSIEDSVFQRCSSLTSITIPNSVTTIREYAFYGCSGLTSMTIGNSVTSIGNSSFSNCRGLTSVSIPNSVTNIGERAFENCSSMISVTVEATTPPTLENDTVFLNTNNCPIYVPCESVDAYKTAWSRYESRIQCKEEPYKAKLTLSDGSTVSISGSGELTYAEISAYQATCVSVEIASACTSIGNNALSYIFGITSITIPDSVTSIGKSAFEACTGLTSATIGSGVTSIGDAAFKYCSGLTSVTIPNSVTSIGSGAFTYCSGLTSITVEATTPPTLGSSAFINTNNCPIYVPCESVDAYKAAWSAYESRITCVPTYKARLTLNDGSIVTISGSGELTRAETSGYSATCVSAEIGSACTGIGQYAFQRCSDLTSVIIGNSVTSIGRGSFEECRILTSVTIGNSVTSIGHDAFYGCSGLTSVSIPNSVTTIEYDAFEGCSSLTSMTIPSGVTLIQQYAFYNCSGLTSITVEAATPPTLGINVFLNTNNCPIYVPAESVDAYKSAAYWNTYASRITAIP